MSGDRAQINFDFAIGVSLLAISMIVALTMVPSLFGGVTEGQMQGDQVAADRVASNLVEGDLGDPSRPYRLEGVCARALFDSSAEFCGLDATGSDALGENVGVTDRNVNVEIRSPTERQCWDPANEVVVDASDPVCADDDEFIGGGNHESANELASATRTATLDGADVTVIVRVW